MTAPATDSTTAPASAAPEPSDDVILKLVGFGQSEEAPVKEVAATVSADPPKPEEQPAEVDEEAEEVPLPVEEDDPELDVPVDGTVEKVRLTELKRGYAGQKKITQTMQQQAVERERIAREATEVAASRDRYSQRLELLEQTISAQMPEEPDYEALRKESPERYLEARAAHDAMTRKLALVQQERERVNQESQLAAQRRHEEFVRAEQAKLTERIPEWKSQDTFAKEAAALRTYLLAEGYSEQEVAGVVDHRAVTTARKAMLYDQIQKGTKPAVQKAVAQAPVIKPGATQPAKKPMTAVDKARLQFKKTGSTKDAEALMLAQIEAGVF